MKRFAIFFAINYASMVLLMLFLYFIAPAAGPGAPPLKGFDSFLELIARLIVWLMPVYTFPYILVVGRVPFLMCILVPSAFWSAVFIYVRRLLRVYRHAA
jgi:hypothetical protein